jgi:hypothetical protein
LKELCYQFYRNTLLRRGLEGHVYPVFGALPVEAIDAGLVLRVLEPIWHDKPATAMRVRAR